MTFGSYPISYISFFGKSRTLEESSTNRSKIPGFRKNDEGLIYASKWKDVSIEQQQQLTELFFPSSLIRYLTK